MNIDRIISIAAFVATLVFGSITIWATLIANAAPAKKSSATKAMINIALGIAFFSLMSASAWLFSSGEYKFSVVVAFIGVLGYWIHFIAQRTPPAREEIVVVGVITAYLAMLAVSAAVMRLTDVLQKAGLLNG